MPMGVGEPGQGILKNREGRILSGSAEQQLARSNLIRDAIINAGGRPTSNTSLDVAKGYIGAGGASQPRGTGGYGAGRVGAMGSGGGGGRGGGGGYSSGGGGAAMNQAQMDWLAKLLQQGAPQAQQANQLQLGAYQAYQPQAFNGQMYDQLQGQWNAGVAQDTARAKQAGADLTRSLQSGYQNSFANQGPQVQVGASQQAMGNFLQSQGVDPSAGQDIGVGGANAAFQNLWQSMALNEDQAQRARLANVGFQTNDAVNRINALGMGGTAGIGIARGNAQQAHDARQADYANQDRIAQQQRADQLAMQNWQRQNQVADANLAAQQGYRNSQLEALLGLLPSMNAGNLPDLAAIFGGAAPAPAANPNIPYWTG